MYKFGNGEVEFREVRITILGEPGHGKTKLSIKGPE